MLLKRSGHRCTRSSSSRISLTWLCAAGGLAALGALGVTQGAAAQVKPHAGMLRFPDVSATSIVFVYANDLWIVPRDGGMATPLASPPGGEAFPKFSSDGKSIA